MEKLVYLIWGEKGDDANALRRQLLDDCAPRLLARGTRGLSVRVDDSDSDVPTPMPWPDGQRSPGVGDLRARGRPRRKTWEDSTARRHS